LKLNLNGIVSRDGNDGKAVKMCNTACGKCLITFFILLVIFSFWVFISADYIRLLEDDLDSSVDTPLVLETDRLPMISPDKKVIYVASEEGLPIAHNFILRNPSIPVEKIVFKKPGHNSTLHVFPIQRDALLATNHDFSKTELPGISAFIFMIIFTSVGIYLLLCKDLFGCPFSRSSEEMISCDTCFEFDPNMDLVDLDDPFDSPSSSPFGSPIKPKKDNKIYKLNPKNADELKPLIIV